MKRAVKRRLALAGAIVATLGAVGTLVGGFSFGLFSSTGTSGANTFTAGTVTVGAGTPASVTCTIASMLPGDSSAGAPIGGKADTTCTYNVKYTGSASAWLGVDVTVTNGSTALYDGSATGVTSGLSASSSSSGNSFAASTVTLDNSSVANCPVSGLLPNGSAAACTFTAAYLGPAAAYLAVDVVIETQAGTGGTRLYNPTDSANDLRITITSASPAVTFTVPSTATTCPTGAPSGSDCYELDNELISTAPVTNATVAFSVSVSLPSSSPTGYQGGTAQITLTTRAVQSSDNTLSCTATPAAGTPCTPGGSFKWS